MELFKIKSKSYADMGNKNRPQSANCDIRKK